MHRFSQKDFVFYILLPELFFTEDKAQQHLLCCGEKTTESEDFGSDYRRLVVTDRNRLYLQVVEMCFIIKVCKLQRGRVCVEEQVRGTGKVFQPEGLRDLMTGTAITTLSIL